MGDNRFVLVDWQCTGVGRVVWEIHYFLRCVPFKAELEDYVLKEYYKALGSFNPAACLDYPWEEFIKDYYLIILQRAVHFVMETYGEIFTWTGKMKFARSKAKLAKGLQDPENKKEMARYQLVATQTFKYLRYIFETKTEMLAGFVAD